MDRSELDAVLAEAGFDATLFNPRQHESCELVERYALALAIDLAGRLELGPALAGGVGLDELLAARGFVPRFRIALAWILDRLALAGLLSRDGAGRYRLVRPLSDPDLAPLRTAGIALDPSYAPAYALLDEAAALYPAVARGEASGEQALFRKLALWFAYFSNANSYYAINNRVAAAAVAARLAPGAAVLEVGAGLGSATEALLERIGERGTLGSYRLTEPVALFRRRAERTLATAYPSVPLSFGSLDINQPWAAQGIEAGSVQLVWGVNVFHLARSLPAVLAEARAAFAPGGWLVVGEGLRPFPREPVGAELPFQILESFVDVDLDPGARPTPGFLTAEEWLGALARAGFLECTLVPDAIRLRAIHPGFYAAAVCGRAPGVTRALAGGAP
jgi:SAM-dependent methyltransferase